ASHDEGEGRAERDDGAPAGGEGEDELRRSLRPVDRRGLGQPLGAPRLVLLRQWLRGRPGGRGLHASFGQRRVVGLPELDALDPRAGRCRRLPGAVPARLCGQDPRCRGRIRLSRADAAGEAARQGDPQPEADRRAARDRECPLPDEGGRAAFGDGTGRRSAGAVRDRPERGAAAPRRSGAGPLPLLGAALRPGPAGVLLFGVAAAALLAAHTVSVAVLAAVLLAVCLRAPGKRRWPYLVGALGSAAVLFVVTPFVEQLPGVVYWSGPTIPVVGTLDVTSTELSG